MQSISSVILLLLLLIRGIRCDAEAAPPQQLPLPPPSPPESAPILSSRTVHTKYGDVRGVIWELDGRHLGSVEVFRGVPYASPPLGNLRFMPPVTGALWRGVKMADRFSPVCPQRLPNISDEQAALKKMPKERLEYLKRLLPYLQNQSEDCLYLNIYAPAQAVVPRKLSGPSSQGQICLVATTRFKSIENKCCGANFPDKVFTNPNITPCLSSTKGSSVNVFNDYYLNNLQNSTNAIAFNLTVKERNDVTDNGVLSSEKIETYLTSKVSNGTTLKTQVEFDKPWGARIPTIVSDCITFADNFATKLGETVNTTNTKPLLMCSTKPYAFYQCLKWKEMTECPSPKESN